jgi:PKD repeat protein
MRKYFLLIFFFVYSITIFSQDCSIISKANDILPTDLCSPVSVDWTVTYRGVNNNGTPVTIRYNWDDGTTQTVIATNTNPDPTIREWSTTSNHIYNSNNQCNYQPAATLIVNGQVCTSSEQQQIVTIWDNDNSNGGFLNIQPRIYPICFGNGANVRFRDVTRFNCVPPQENDVPNLETRWIQWVYGTDITMTGTPVTINGVSQIFPYYGNIITLPAPVAGSGIYSQWMNVANDKLVGQYFQVTLRYWNYCNPYDDPNISGLPVDLINGDNPPVTTTAIILIVPYPNATINNIPDICRTASPINLTAATNGGTWSGDGVINGSSGLFSPSVADAGQHIIRYDVTDGNGCSNWDTAIVNVLPTPVVNITDFAPICFTTDTFDLGVDFPSGSWSGGGIVDNTLGLFSPTRTGDYMISFSTPPDTNGCVGVDQTTITVYDLPNAWFITKDSAFCDKNSNIIPIEIYVELFGGITDLILSKNGVSQNINNITTNQITVNDTIAFDGLYDYNLISITEYHDSLVCSSSLNDSIELEVYPLPNSDFTISADNLCSPVIANFTSQSGFLRYDWNFDDGASETNSSSILTHGYINNSIHDTIFHPTLTVYTDNNCVSTTSHNISIYPRPIADFFVAPIEQIFPSSTVLLDNLSNAGNWLYYWNFGDNLNITIKEPLNHIYSNYGTYNIFLKTYSLYCSDSITKSIIILPPPPMTDIEMDSSGCPPFTVIFRNNTTFADSYIWDFGDGFYSTEYEPTHTFYESGTYNVVMSGYGMSGVSKDSVTITVYPHPVALFNVYPEESVDLNQLFKFYNTSIDMDRCYWTFGDGSTSTDIHPSYTYTAEGEYDIILYVWSENNCTDSIIKDNLIRVNSDEGFIVFPNAFRWNGVGSTGGYWDETVIDNTVFRPHPTNVSEYKLEIYNRWGNLIYESNQLEKGWDGYLDDGLHLAIQGVYVWKCWVTYTSGRKEILSGYVTFLH